MIIISRDKSIIVNFDNVNSIDIDIVVDPDGIDKETPYIISYETNSKREELGIYKTEERAKEVLKDIISRYEAIELCKNKSSEDLGFSLADYSPIYEMPKE